MFAHEHFKILNKIRSKKIPYRELSDRLNFIISISSTIFDPNFIETPFLNNMLKYLFERYRYDDFYKSLRDTMNVLIAHRMQRLLIYLNIGVIIVGIVSTLLFFKVKIIP